MPSLSLPPADASKLAKLCGMFASDYEGERANAAQMADSMLRKCGVSWDQVFQATVQPKSTGLRTPVTDPARWEEMSDHGLAMLGLRYRAALFDGEEDFLKTIMRQSVISPKQSEWLKKIGRRCAAYAAR